MDDEVLNQRLAECRREREERENELEKQEMTMPRARHALRRLRSLERREASLGATIK